jgi:hypothetical protein
MITFKQFLAEEPVGQRPEFEKVKTEKAVKMLNMYCKDAIWMLQKNKPFYRGEKYLEHSIAHAGFITVDPSKTERKSQNTYNYYTVLLDNNPLCKAFPKRSRSFIGTTDRWNADSYSSGGAMFAMIPFDGVKIGAVNDDDMWDSHINMFGSKGGTIESYNTRFKRLDLKASVKSFEAFGNELASSGDAKRKFRNEFNLTTDEQAEHFMENIWAAYGPESTGFTVHTTKDAQDIHGEVWVGGPVMYIGLDMWDKLRKAIDARDESKYFD